MKQSIYSIVFFLIVSVTFSQTKEVMLKESFKVDANTTLNLDLENVAILFEESFDGKIHFDYSMTFGRYSKRKREMIKKQAKVKVVKKNDLITLNVKNSMFLEANYQSFISIDSLIFSVDGFVKSFKANKNQYKTKDSLVNEIKFSEGNNFRNFLKRNKNKYKKNTSFKNKKVIKKVFIIKVPQSVTIRLKALHSNLVFNYNIHKPIVAHTFKGHLKFKKIESVENEFFITNGVFEAEEITGGSYNFKDVSKTLIGSVSNSKISTETSKIEVGEISKNVKIKDFNSKFNFYNFSKSFKSFNLKGDYSKLHFFKNTDVYSLTANGNTTAFNINKQKFSFEPRKKGLDRFIMLEMKAPKNKQSYGHINLNITHGIIEIISNEKE